ncbi:hypothetical protein LTR17_002399 [Elasticomyces elasticus]|nr:hypothetical protein LTR17_002399 [Elasticomyces elasticus]
MAASIASGPGILNPFSAGTVALYDPEKWGRDTHKFLSTQVKFGLKTPVATRAVNLALVANDALCKRPASLEKHIDGLFVVTQAGARPSAFEQSTRWAAGAQMGFIPMKLSPKDRKTWNEAQLYSKMLMVSSHYKDQRVGAKFPVLPIWTDTNPAKGDRLRRRTSVLTSVTPKGATPGAYIVVEDDGSFIWSTADTFRSTLGRNDKSAKTWAAGNVLPLGDDGDRIVAFIR